MNIQSKEITKSITASIVAAHSEVNLDGKLWAINWFDVKSEWLYNFYNKLAVGHVMKVGGRPLFKASRIETIMGSEEDERQIILVVRYPKANAFLKMVSSKVFQLKSLIRKFAVVDFTIGFMYASEDNLQPKGELSAGAKKLLYLVHHFKGKEDDQVVENLKKLAIEKDIFLQFIGRKEALIGMSKNGENMTTVPFIMDHLMIFGAFEKTQFDELIASELYQELIAKNDSNYMGIFSRMF